MALAYYTKQNKTVQQFVAELPRFLVDDLPGKTGPGGWKIIKTYSSGAATPHELPSGTGVDFDTELAADNAWVTGALNIGDYIILESGKTPNADQVGFEYQAIDTLRVILAPQKGFDTATSNNDMTAAGNWTNPTCSYVDHDDNSAGALQHYSAVADESTIMLFMDPGNSTYMCFGYIGEHERLHDEDEYNSLIFRTVREVNMHSGYGFGDHDAMYKISPVDDSTEIFIGGALHYMDGIYFTSNTQTLDRNPVTGEWSPNDIILASTTSGHTGKYGKLRHLRYMEHAITNTIPTVSTAMDYIAIGDSATYGKLIMPWDGVTPY